LVTIFEGTAIVSAASAIFVSIFALAQLRHLEKHRNVEISMKLFEWAETDRLRRAFKWMDRQYPFKTYSEFKSFEEKDAEAAEYPFEVVGFFEQVGFLVEKKFIDLDVVVDRLGNSVIQNWRKLEPLIMGVRQERNDLGYGEHFLRLYNQTVKYMRKGCESGNNNFCTTLETPQ
jgi:hypothetical protein